MQKTYIKTYGIGKTKKLRNYAANILLTWECYRLKEANYQQNWEFVISKRLQKFIAGIEDVYVY